MFVRRSLSAPRARSLAHAAHGVRSDEDATPAPSAAWLDDPDVVLLLITLAHAAISTSAGIDIAIASTNANANAVGNGTLAPYATTTAACR